MLLRGPILSFQPAASSEAFRFSVFDPHLCSRSSHKTILEKPTLNPASSDPLAACGLDHRGFPSIGFMVAWLLGIL